MTFVIVTRNPYNKKLLFVSGENPEDPAEFETESDANAVAMAVPVCEAWGYQTIEIDFPRG